MSEGLNSSEQNRESSKKSEISAEKQKSQDWRVMLKSVQGANHKRNDLPNQDYGDTKQPNANKLPIIVAISDGHGSPKSFRSHLGSEFAVQTALELLEGLVDQKSDQESLSAVRDYVGEKLKKSLVSKWKEKVDHGLEKYPFEPKELDKLEQEKGVKARQEVENHQYLAYGATLLAVLITEKYNLYLQLGDGDILCIDTQGNTTQPIPEDKNLIANETYSLCMKEAWKYIKDNFVLYTEEETKQRPMILISTDGYANSFEEKNFMRIGKDYLDMIRTEGFDQVKGQLEDILNQTSDGGSGDDITFALIKKIDYKDRTDKLIDVDGKLINLSKEFTQLKELVQKNISNNQEEPQSLDQKIEKIEEDFAKDNVNNQKETLDKIQSLEQDIESIRQEITKMTEAHRENIEKKKR